MNIQPSSTLVPVAIALLVGWRLFARVRRMVGRQRLSKVRPWVTVILFPLLAAALLAGALRHPPSAWALTSGLVAGLGLAVVGLRLTRFEQTEAGLFYTPNAHLGIALSLLLVLRIGYRFLQGGLGAGRGGDLLASPLTLAIFGTLSGYYVAYAIGLLRWRRRVAAADPADAPAPPDL